MTTTNAYGKTDLLEELQSALTNGPLSRRVQTLRRVTDLFVMQADGLSSDQIALFDDVFNYLVQHIEAEARIVLSERLSAHAMSPPRIVRALAFDDLIEVAAPMLAHSDGLDDATLIENVSTKSQAHLLAISARKTLSHQVTDALLARGDDTVLESTARNSGARFSDNGYERLVARANGNDALAIAVGLHKHIPRPHYLKLIARASRAVRDRLEAEHAGSPELIADAVKQAANDVRRHGPGSAASEAARRLVRSLFADNRLDEAQILAFARGGKFDEIGAALSCLAGLPVETVEDVMLGSSSEGVLVLAKVAGLSWPVVKAILDMRDDILGAAPSSGEIDVSQEGYERLRSTTAQQVLRFYQMQQSAAAMPAVEVA